MSSSNARIQEYLDYVESKKVNITVKRELPLVTTILQSLDKYIDEKPDKSLYVTYQNKKAHDDAHWIDMLEDLDNSVRSMARERDEFIDKEKSILRIERKQHLQNLMFRVLTTGAIGLTIMGIYALAHWLGIPMPLMRLPV